MSLTSLRDAIISQFALVNHTQTSRKFIPPAVTPPALSQDWQSPADPNAYHPQRAMAECIANAVEPEITNRVDLNVKQRFDPTAEPSGRPLGRRRLSRNRHGSRLDNQQALHLERHNLRRDNTRYRAGNLDHKHKHRLDLFGNGMDRSRVVNAGRSDKR